MNSTALPDSLSTVVSKMLREPASWLKATLGLTVSPYRHIRRLTTTFNSPMPCIDVAHQHLITARALHQAAQQVRVIFYSVRNGLLILV